MVWLKLICIISIIFGGIVRYAIAWTYETQHYILGLTIVADGLKHPWGAAFLPDGALLVTERSTGTIRIIESDGTIKPPLANVPKSYNSGQGGMLDVAIDPHYIRNKFIYFSYSKVEKSVSGTAVARGRLNRKQNALSGVELIFEQQPKSKGNRHFGSRLALSSDRQIFITLGDRGERDQVQDFTVNRGQVIRLELDGSVPTSNPFLRHAEYRPEIWSVGHRNPQGIAIHPSTGDLWISEHGARGGDEINLLVAGANFGWPIIAYGTHYSGAKIGEGTHRAGLEQPVYYWDPSIAPSGITFYTGHTFLKWKNDLFVSALRAQLLVRLSLDGDKIINEERMLEGINKRIRTVLNGPNGNLYLLVDEDPGQVIRLDSVSAIH